jgi:hypothetical protein
MDVNDSENPDESRTSHASGADDDSAPMEINDANDVENGDGQAQIRRRRSARRRPF